MSGHRTELPARRWRYEATIVVTGTVTAADEDEAVDNARDDAYALIEEGVFTHVTDDVQITEEGA